MYHVLRLFELLDHDFECHNNNAMSAHTVSLNKTCIRCATSSSTATGTQPCLRIAALACKADLMTVEPNDDGGGGRLGVGGVERRRLPISNSSMRFTRHTSHVTRHTSHVIGHTSLSKPYPRSTLQALCSTCTRP